MRVLESADAVGDVVEHHEGILGLTGHDCSYSTCFGMKASHTE